MCAAHLDKLPAAPADKTGTAGAARRRPGTDMMPYAAVALVLLAGCLFAVLFTRYTRLRRRPTPVVTGKHKEAVPRMSLPAAQNANPGELSVAASVAW